MKRIGILTSGGDCQGLNAAIRGVGKALFEYYGEDGIEIYGIMNGYKGLINSEYRLISPGELSGILTQGGTILGTSRQPFKTIRVIEDDNIDKIKCMKMTYKKLKLDCLAILGGNGTQKTANLLSNEGINVVSLPKTIDNDLWGTDVTFGFHSAVNIATNVIDCIHTTATSHGRIFIVELMGHKVGWLTLYAGMSSGADVILIPEIHYDLNVIIRTIEKREQKGKNFSIIAMAEGAMSKEFAKIPKVHRKKVLKSGRYSTIAYKLSEDLEINTGNEVRVTVPGHFQRGGTPCPYDRVLATQFGTMASELIIKQKYGTMAAINNGKMNYVLLKDIAGKLKAVDPCNSIVKGARDIGISFGS